MICRIPIVYSTKSSDQDLLQGCTVSSDFFQSSLPRLPIPKLDKTGEKYLASQRVLLNDEDYSKTETFTKNFLENEGKGATSVKIVSTYIYLIRKI